jgi:hypothetical protein
MGFHKNPKIFGSQKQKSVFVLLGPENHSDFLGRQPSAVDSAATINLFI